MLMWKNVRRMLVMALFYLLSSPWPMGDEKLGIEARQSDGTLPLTYLCHLTDVFQ